MGEGKLGFLLREQITRSPGSLTNFEDSAFELVHVVSLLSCLKCALGSFGDGIWLGDGKLIPILEANHPEAWLTAFLAAYLKLVLGIN